MGKGSSGAARRAQKAKNSTKRTEKEEKNTIPSSSTDHQSQSDKLNEECNNELPKLERDSSNIQDSEGIEIQKDKQCVKQGTNLTVPEERNSHTSIDTHLSSPDHVPEPEISTMPSANHSEPVDAKKSYEIELEKLREQVRVLESELQELRQTLAESHQAFAEQIVQMSATKDQEKDTELLQLKENWDRCQSDLRVQMARVHTLEMQLEGRDKALDEKSSLITENSVAMADMQAKINVCPNVLLQDLVSKASAPTTESLAKVAMDLGYSKESDYVRCYLLMCDSPLWRKYAFTLLTTASCGT